MTEQDTVQAPTANGSGGLGSLKLAQLKDLASQLGITGTSRMRKAQLVEVIADHQRGGSPVAEQKPAAKAVDVKQDKSAKASEQPKHDQQKVSEQPAPQDTSAQADKAERTPVATDETAGQQTDDDQPKQRGQQSRGRRGSRGGQQRDAQQTRDTKNAEGQAETQSETADKDQDSAKESDDNTGQDRQRGRTRNQQRRDQDRQRRDQQDTQDDQDSDDSSTDEQSDSRRHRDDDQRNQRRQRQRDRNRSRDRRREQEDEDDQDQEVSEDETLIPISGILDVLDNYAFVRTSGYLPGPNDVYVSMAMVKRFGLRKGDAIRGRVRAPQADDDKQQNQQGGRGGGRGGRGGRNRRGGGGSGGGSNRQKFNALVKIDSLNGQEAAENPKRVEFNKLTPLYPQERLRLEHQSKDMGPRLVDLVAPIGKGQRGLIVSPPKAGKTMMLQSIANAITTNNPEVKLMMVLVDERPEEVTDMQRSVRGEVIASTFDRPAEDHTTVAELSIERAKRMVELGHDVVVLLDSMTRLGRAYNLATPASGRILSGGVDSAALYPPKKFFGAARNIEGGGSLTILATALVETGSRMDEVIFEEFKGTGNMELRLSRELSERRIFPAIDINASGTRREENLLTKEEIGIMWRLRRVLSGLETQQALELLTSKLKETETNAEFLMLVSKTTLRGQSES